MPKRGERATPSQRAALERGQRKRAEALAKGDGDGANKRWRMLLDGTLSVQDLDDDEVARMRTRGKGKQFSGPAPRLPSHLAQQFAQERVKRSMARLHAVLPKALAELERILDDPDAKDADKLKAITIGLERSLGKTPETVVVKTDDKWGSLLDAGANLSDVRDLSDLENS